MRFSGIMIPPPGDGWAPLTELRRPLPRRIVGWDGVGGLAMELQWEPAWGYQGADGTFVCGPYKFITHFKTGAYA
jgi:hypothetical protein